MVDSIKPTYRSIAAPPVKGSRQQEAQGVESHSDQRDQNQRIWAGRDRRRGGDRRDRETEAQKKAMFDMRNSKGRRKTDRVYPKIEIKV